MQFRDLSVQYQNMQQEMDHAIKQVCTQSDFISGQPVKDLESALADYTGRKHCITCANGTDALQLALMAIGIKNTDAVFVPDFTFFATGEAPAVLGAVPVFVDVDYDTYNMLPESLEKAVERVAEEGRLTPKAVIAVDLFGQPAEYDKIEEIAHKYHMFVIEDGAQGFGGRIGSRMACSFGDLSTTSFFPAKPLGCYGDGGAVFTDQDEYAALIRSLAVHGRGEDKYDNIRLGMNSRLDTIQAAVLRIKLKKFAEYELEAVNRAADLYTQKLKNIVGVPVIRSGYYTSWAQYTIKLPSSAIRQKLMDALGSHGIPSMIYYKKPLHAQKAFGNIDTAYAEPGCSNTDQLCDQVLQLPIHPYITEQEICSVCEVIEEVSGILR